MKRKKLKIIKRFIDYNNNQLQHARHERGSGLIIVILVLAFLLAVGTALISVTGINSKVAGNIRTQHQAFNAAEAGFDATWIAIEDSFIDETWTSFDEHYLRDPAGIDLPADASYFRKLTDTELLNLLGDFNAGTKKYDKIIFYKQRVVPSDSRLTYTAFLIDDEAGGGTSDATDALLVCIGSVGTGSNMITTRLEIELDVELEGMT